MTSPRASVGWLSVIFVPVGMGMLLIAGWMLSRDPLFSGAGAEAVGTVVDLERSASGNGKASYYPVVTYRDAAGAEHRFTGSIGSNPPGYARGEEVSVRYDPAAPEEAVIDSWSVRALGPGLTGGMGLLLLWMPWRAIRSGLAARRRARVLARGGIDLPAQLIEVFRDANVADSGGRWFRIACEAQWPASGEPRRFFSEPVPTDPTPQLATGRLTVRVDPADHSNYAVILG
ncbi:MAG: DUF3592 domain-containing protein [Erythrobacter sp.]|uniref:DUF3592 domain-containing protein n=1 Tax=Erythrobacter sp. TaxID=1042 RepID=UPI0025D21079|nr:DUF3592 domain-containing protein [Erythrobacter sp.]MCM0000036.1 DUF3592 domain-containing protein [Erythrobacter sp.]